MHNDEKIRTHSWTVCVASDQPYHLGFSKRSPHSFYNTKLNTTHVWGQILHLDGSKANIESLETDKPTVILVLGTSQAIAGSISNDTSINCSGIVSTLLPNDFPILNNQMNSATNELSRSTVSNSALSVFCLLPGCSNSLISKLEANKYMWPFCSPETKYPDGRFFPALTCAMSTTVWICFDPKQIVSLASFFNIQQPQEMLKQLKFKFGSLPTLLISTLLPNLTTSKISIPAQLNSNTEQTSGKLRNRVINCSSFICKQSYSLTLLSSNFQLSWQPFPVTNCITKSVIFPYLVLILALYLLFLLSLSTVVHLIAKPDDIVATSQCQAYLTTLRKLINMSILLPNATSAKTQCTYNSVNSFVFQFRQQTQCSVAGPIQDTVLDFVKSFILVSLEAVKSGCLFDVLLASTEFFATELVQLLFWLGSGHPAGLKINRHLALLMSRFFLSHIGAWKVYVEVLINLFAVFAARIYTISVLFESRVILNGSIILHILAMIPVLRLVEVFTSRKDNKIQKLVAVLSASLRLSVSLILCICLDMLAIASLHLSCFYVYTVRLFRVQLLAVSSTWRLCRSGSKWNPLRCRVDTIPKDDDLPPIVACAVLVTPENEGKKTNQFLETEQQRNFIGPCRHMDRLFVATFLGIAIGLCLLPTTFAFYATFSIIYVCLVIVKIILIRVICFVLSFPTASLVAWLFNCMSIRTNLVSVQPTYDDSVGTPFISLQLVRDDLSSCLKRNSLFDASELAGCSKSLMDVFEALIYAKLL